MPTALVEKIKTAAVKLPGERRNVTVLLVDMADLTTVAATCDLDRESIYLLIDEAIALLADAAYDYGGTIDKFTGDGLMILFGAPVAHENDPELAVRTALDMLTTIQPLSQHLQATHDCELQLRIGISTGEVIAGRMGNDLHMEYTVTGDVVDITVNLKETAELGTILVSPETYQRTSTIFEYEITPSVDQDGRQRYRPIRLSENPEQKPGSSTRRRLPLVGRSGELTQLEQALATVCRDKERRIVRLTGEAGIGKSRLLAEFRQKISRSDIRIFQAHCLAYTRSQPLSVAAKMVREIIGMSETEPAQVQHAAIQRYLDQMKLDQAEIWPYLAHLLGLEQAEQVFDNRLALLDGSMLQRQVHVALRQIFLAEAQQSPIVVIFEDLQWLDPASKEFLQYLVQTTGEASLMLILVSRPTDHGSTFSSLQTIIRNEANQLVELQLEALSDTETELLVEEFITDNTPETQAIKQEIIQRGKGNPFYLGELIGMLIDRGGLIRASTDGTWQVTPDATELLKAVPSTIKDLILARFDSLPEDLRRTLQLAAVLGTTLPISPMFQLRGLNADTLAIHLKELERRHFLSSDPSKTNAEYEFRHALFQEVIYSTLLKRDRRQAHDQIAQAIEQSESGNLDERVESLAYHYFESTRPLEAVPYLIKSADKAARRSAHEIAVEQYRRVMSLLPDQPDSYSQEFFRVSVGLGRSLKYVGELTEAGQLLSEALPQLWRSSLAAQSATLWPVLVEILRQLADIRQREGTYDEALAYLESGLQVLGEAGAAENPELWCKLVERQAWIHFRQGRLQQAFDLADSAVQRLGTEEIDDPVMLAKLLNTLGGISWQQGNREKAIDYTRRSLELFESIGYLWGVGTAHNNLGILYDVLGNWAKGIEYHQQAYAIQKNIGDIEGQARSLDNLGILHMIMGEHQTARQEMEASLAIRQKLGDRYGLAQSHASLAELALIQQEPQEAMNRGEAALKLADTIKSIEIQVYARWILAMVQAEQQKLELGLTLAGEALEMARQAGFVEGEVDCLRVLGALKAKIGEHQAAQVLFQNSAQLAQQQNDPYRHGLAFLESGLAYLSLVQADQPNQLSWRAKAVISLNEAIQRTESLGAAHHRYQAQLALKKLQSDTHIEE
jgi:class 3 adenylate cyclase/tetratricopeptide (TPR) repeat protein